MIAALEPPAIVELYSNFIPDQITSDPLVATFDNLQSNVNRIIENSNEGLSSLSKSLSDLRFLIEHGP